jgi:integrase
MHVDMKGRQNSAKYVLHPFPCPLTSELISNGELATLRRILRFAHEWRVIDRVPIIRMISGERPREAALDPHQEQLYLEAAPEPLASVALLMPDTGLRVGEALALRWRDVNLTPRSGPKFGMIRVREGKSRNAQRIIPLTERVARMLTVREREAISTWAFPGIDPGKPLLVTSFDHQHAELRRLLRLPKDLVLHSLRHTTLTRLGESGVDAFTIMKIAGHSSVTVSERYVHPGAEAIERAFQRLEAQNSRGGLQLSQGKEVQPPATKSATPSE